MASAKCRSGGTPFLWLSRTGRAWLPRRAAACGSAAKMLKKSVPLPIKKVKGSDFAEF
jgi:hypothetical protein